jgi:hypothetical protein
MKSILKHVILAAFSFLLVIQVSAKDGMWIPTLLKALNQSDMQTMGLELTAEDIYSINQASIKDAIVHFGGGCTAEVISDQGLILTNHHCGYGQIQYHSSVENDYLTDGFWAMNRSEELANPGLTATFIVRIEQVTKMVNEGIERGMTDEEKAAIRTANREKIEEKAAGESEFYDAQIKPFFYGNQYFMIVTKTYKDVRLVGAPPSSIGKFGGDTDNWMWPRHTGDFSIFRIYANEENEPAEYSEDNVPFNPAYHLPISLDGVDEGDFTMVFGFPGRTEQFLTSHAVDYVMNQANPARIEMRETSLSIIDAARLESDKVRIQYAAKQSRISNAYKKWIGQNNGLKKLDALQKKKDFEEEFMKRAAEADKEEYENLISEFEVLYADIEPYQLGRDYFIEYFFYGPELMYFASSFRNLVEDYKELKKSDKLDETIEGLKGRVEGHFKDYHEPTDRLIFEKLTELYTLNAPEEFQPEILKNIETEYGGDVRAFRDELYQNSIFTDREALLALLEDPSKKAIKKLESDPGYQLMTESYESYYSHIRPNYNQLSTAIDEKMKTYVKAIMELFPDDTYWPDANSTMRLSYGKAEGSEPRDGMLYKFYTTSEGILEKYEPGSPDFDLPQRLIDLIEEGDFGAYATDGELRVCFTGSNHTTGGNSGSPALNGRGQLIGLNFDRSWESTMSDIMYDPDRCRNIMVDIKYVLFIVDKYAGAKHLIDEMTLVLDTGEEAETN